MTEQGLFHPDYPCRIGEQPTMRLRRTSDQAIADLINEGQKLFSEFQLSYSVEAKNRMTLILANIPAALRKKLPYTLKDLRATAEPIVLNYRKRRWNKENRGTFKHCFARRA